MRSVIVAVAAIVLCGSAAHALETAGSPTQDYEDAVRLLRVGRLAEAEEAWRVFLRQYPDDRLAGNAQYMLGETYFRLGEMPNAVVAYAEVAVRYPAAPLAADSILRLGVTLDRVGRGDEACETFQRLDREFPRATDVVRERVRFERERLRCPFSPVAATVEPPKETAAKPKPAPAAKKDPPPAKPDAAEAKETPEGEAGVMKLPADYSLRVAPPKRPETKVAGPGATLAEPILKMTSAPREPVERVALAGSHAPAARAAAPSRVASSDSIRATQALLAALEFDPGPPDGQAGPRLKGAVKAFQTREGIHPDGEVSDALLKRLATSVATRRVATREPRRAGTGIVVSRAGDVLASLSTLGACKDIRAHAAGSDAIAASIVGRDERNDLVLLRLKEPREEIATFRAGRSPRTGDPVVVTSYSGTADLDVATASVSGLVGPREDTRLLRLSKAPGPGQGGAPLFDEGGRVAGLILARDNPLLGGGAADAGFALRATLARSFLDAHDVAYDEAQAGESLDPAEIGKRAKRVSVILECWR